MDNRTTIQVSEDIRRRLKIMASRKDRSYEELLSAMLDVCEELKPDQVVISIPTPLADKIREHCKGTSFGTLSDYATYVLREILAGIEKGEPHKAEISRKEEELVKERLRRLGYLN